MMNIINETKYEFPMVVLKKVLRKTANKRNLGLMGTLTIFDFDCDRIYIKNESSEEFTIRTWNVFEYGSKGTLRVIYTFFKDLETEIKIDDWCTTSCLEIGCGFVNVLQEELEEII